MMAVVILAFASASCADHGSGEEISLSPFAGIWQLSAVNDVDVTDPAMVDRYMFTSDPDKPAQDSGIGKYYYHESSDPAQWSSCDIRWAIVSPTEITIDAPRGGGSFQWMVSTSYGYSTLRLYDAATGTERVYMR